MRDGHERLSRADDPPATDPRERRHLLAGIGRELGGQLVADIRSDRATGLAAEIAFWAALSVFPGLIALGSLLGWIDSVFGAELAARAQDQLLAFLGRSLSDGRSGTIDAARDALETRGSVLGTAVLGSVWAASRGFAAVIRALDIGYRVPETRTWLGTRGTALVLSLGSLVVGSIALASITAASLPAEQSDLEPVFGAAWSLARLSLMAVIVVGWAAVIYHFAPNHHTPFRWELPGAIVATLWWGAASVGFGTYVRIAEQGGSSIYTALGGALSLLLFLWLLALGLLVGGKVNAVLAGRFSLSRPRGSRLALVVGRSQAGQRVAGWSRARWRTLARLGRGRR